MKTKIILSAVVVTILALFAIGYSNSQSLRNIHIQKQVVIEGTIRRLPFIYFSAPRENPRIRANVSRKTPSPMTGNPLVKQKNSPATSRIGARGRLQSNFMRTCLVYPEG